MKFERTQGAPVETRCDLLAVAVFDDQLREGEVIQALDKKLDGLLLRLFDDEQFKAKKAQTLLVHTHGKLGGQRLLLVGCGPRADFQPADLRSLGGRAAKTARTVGAKSVALAWPGGLDEDRATQMASEGVLLGRYRFDRYHTDENRRQDQIETVLLHGADSSKDGFGKAVARAQIVSAAVARARDWINEPAAEMTPRRMAEEAQKLAKAHGLEATVLGPKECRELGMGMFLAVSQGSAEEPRFIHLAHKPKGATRRVCIIGKGVTFDSGGLSLKPSNAMEDMKVDMSGAAAVLNAIVAVAELKLPIEVHAIAACTENMPSGTSYKLGDVLKSMAGKTVEINNTDAEGRLTLGDAITYALKLEPAEMFDFATLTGACMVALGPHIAGVMTNDQPLCDRWMASAKAAGEEMWQLPLPERLKEQLKSEVADMRNTGERYGGALTAGLFLKEFAGKTPWVHVDIAGPSTSDKDVGPTSKGGVGFAVATIVEHLSR